jgi:hypothetical protein
MMSKLLMVSLFLGVPVIWFTWLYLIYLAGSGVAYISDMVLFIIGGALALIMAVFTIQEFQSMSKSNK